MLHGAVGHVLTAYPELTERYGKPAAVMKGKSAMNINVTERLSRLATAAALSVTLLAGLSAGPGAATAEAASAAIPPLCTYKYFNGKGLNGTSLAACTVQASADRVVVGYMGMYDYDEWHLRWSRPGKASEQKSLAGGQGGSFTINNANANTTYHFAIQACNTNFLSSSDCTGWIDYEITTPGPAYGPDTCRTDYVWREAFAGDHVCVAPASRDRAKADNSQAGARRDPNGAYGPDTCKSGFVWREASPSDHVCVSPATRDATKKENAEAASHRI